MRPLLSRTAANEEVSIRFPLYYRRTCVLTFFVCDFQSQKSIEMSIAQNIARIGVRQLSTTTATRAAKGEVSKGYHDLKKIQERFQVKDGKPVFLKGGAFDSAMYRFTMGLSLVGVGGILKLIYDLSFPAPQE